VATILVSAVGAVIGQGIVRSLRALPDRPFIVGTDIYPDAAGREWCDVFHRAVPVADPDFFAYVAEIVRAHQVDLVLPGFPEEVSALSRGRGHLAGLPARVALNPPGLVELGDDKWATQESLASAGLPAIPSRLAGPFEELASDLGVPFLLKLRGGSASRGIQEVRTAEEYRFWSRRMGEAMVAQRIVGTPEEEFTVGAFGLGDGRSAGHIALRRRLGREGSTAKARVARIPELDEATARLVAHFRPEGPCNFQFRREGGTFYLLEVNPRISASTSMRTAFGYNEAEMCVEYYLLGRVPRSRTLRDGEAVRYLDDVIRYDRDPG
jgi:carbamoyl-phosphate synthase large subunit